jgi:ketosteroid isomerase-like protein
MVDTALSPFIKRCHDALTQQSQGHPEPLLELWSRADDVSIMAAVNGYQVGFEQVSSLLRWASTSQHFDGWSAENLVTVGGSDIACTVEVEHYLLNVDGEDKGMTLRATQIYRLESGEWKIIHRHGDALAAVEVKW